MSNSEQQINSKATATLAAYLSGGRLPHAILAEGIGAGDFARQIAKAALCSHDTQKPCGICRDCQKAEKGAHPDLLIYTGGGKANSFHVETVREIKREAYIRPNEAESKVFVLEDAHQMTLQAQNTLLKVIEEPPPGIIFILTCDNRAAMLETVLSRVSVLSLDAAAYADNPKAAHVLELLISGSELEALAELSVYEKDRPGFQAFLSELRRLAAKKAVEGTARPQMLRLIDIIDETDDALSRNIGGLLAVTALTASFKLELNFGVLK